MPSHCLQQLEKSLVLSWISLSLLKLRTASACNPVHCRTHTHTLISPHPHASTHHHTQWLWGEWRGALYAHDSLKGGGAKKQVLLLWPHQTGRRKNTRYTMKVTVLSLQPGLIQKVKVFVLLQLRTTSLSEPDVAVYVHPTSLIDVLICLCTEEFT